MDEIIKFLEDEVKNNNTTIKELRNNPECEDYGNMKLIAMLFDKRDGIQLTLDLIKNKFKK